MSETSDEQMSNIAHWDIEETHPELVSSFKEKMREVTDPEIGLDIIALGWFAISPFKTTAQS